MNDLHPGADGEFDLPSLIALPFPEKWSPTEAGTIIKGHVEYLRDEQWYGDSVPVIYIPGHKIVASGIVLRRQIEELSVAVGDFIAIRYDGTAVSATSGRTYKKYTMAKE